MYPKCFYKIQQKAVLLILRQTIALESAVVTTTNIGDRTLDLVNDEIQVLLGALGTGKTLGTAYDTAWGARLAAYYPDRGFEQSIEWLRRNQQIDGSWGGPLVHYHDRFISTLASIVALTQVGNQQRDKRRVQRGEKALWTLVGQLGRDDSDTVGFPALSASLVDEAIALGLDVPRAPVRYAKGYRKKVEGLLNAPRRDWLNTTLTFSFEALRLGAQPEDLIQEANASVAVSSSATAGYLLIKSDDAALEYLIGTLNQESDGSLAAIRPIDTFEVVWSLHHLSSVGAVSPHDPLVKRQIEFLDSIWSDEFGVGYSSKWRVPDIDDTAACMAILHWAGRSVSPNVVDRYENEDHFACYPGETNPSLSAHVRLLAALRLLGYDARNQARIKKIVETLYRLDENGSFWWDKWHSSPYYVSSFALKALRGLADDLALSRLRWIIHTQRDDGGWGYLGQSTAEETAYCLLTLLEWDRTVERIDSSRLAAAAAFLQKQFLNSQYLPLWIGKSLYTPYFPVRAAILSALFDYLQWSQ
jgi:halimadienyl-diphosphate synthase